MKKQEIKNFYNYFKNSESNQNSFEIFEGNGNFNNVLVSAPHSVSQFREGKIKIAELSTGVIAKLLNKHYGIPIIVKTKNCNDDANFDEVSDYKEALAKYVNENNIKFVIDLHALSQKKNCDINLGTNYGFNIMNNNVYIDLFNNIANSYNYKKVAIDFPFSSTYEHTIANFVSRTLKIPAIQVEINSKLFYMSYDVAPHKKFVNMLASYIIKLNDYLNFKNYRLTKKEIDELEYKFSIENFDKTPLASKKGGLPIVVSAPHALGSTYEDKTKSSETASGVLAIMLNKHHDTSYIFKSTTKAPDYFNVNPKFYLNQLKPIIKNSKFLIDLHIHNPKRVEDVIIITNYGKTLSGNFNIVSNILEILNKKNFKNISIDSVYDSTKDTRIACLVNKKFKVNAVQLSFNFNLFKNENSYNKVYLVLEEIINYINTLV